MRTMTSIFEDKPTDITSTQWLHDIRDENETLTQTQKRISTELNAIDFIVMSASDTEHEEDRNNFFGFLRG